MRQRMENAILIHVLYMQKIKNKIPTQHNTHMYMKTNTSKENQTLTDKTITNMNGLGNNAGDQDLNATFKINQA
jgi:hypothetical protein